MVISLSVKSRGSQTLVPPVTQNFDTDHMTNIQAVGADTQFTYVDGRVFTVDETLEQVTIAMQTVQPSAGVVSRHSWGILDATAGLATGAHELIDLATGEPMVLPDNAVIEKARYIVDTTFTSAADTATIGLGVEADDISGIIAPVAINDGGTPWDAGAKDAIPDGTSANLTTQTTAASRNILATVGVQALTAGILRLKIDWTIQPDIPA